MCHIEATFIHMDYYLSERALWNSNYACCSSTKRTSSSSSSSSSKWNLMHKISKYCLIQGTLVSIVWYTQIVHAFISYSENCLNGTSLGSTVVFGTDMFSVYTGYINTDFLHVYFFPKFSLYRIQVYSVFDLDRCECIFFRNIKLFIIYLLPGFHFCSGNPIKHPTHMS